jgi:hypothetical protein
VYADPELLGAHSERVEVEIANGWVGAEEMVATKRASGDHHGVAWEHYTGLSHANCWSRNEAKSAPCHFQAFR